MTCNDSDRVDTNQPIQDIGNVNDILCVIPKLQDYKKHKNHIKIFIISMMSLKIPHSTW